MTKSASLIAAIALLPLLASCDTNRNSSMEQRTAADASLVQITEKDSTLPFSDIGLSLEIVSRDARDVPKEIQVTFVNKSSTKACLPLPRPVVESESYDGSLPCLCIGMREIVEFEGLSPAEPIFLYTMAGGQAAGPLKGTFLDPGAKFERRYDLSSFCMIGHGIGPKLPANFSTMYHAGDRQSEMRVYLIAEWINLTRIESNPVTVRLSEPDFSVREKLGDD